MKKDDDLRQIKELLEIVKHKVDVMDFSNTGQSASIHLMKEQQSVMNEKLDAISKDLNDPKTGLAAINDRLEDPKTGLKRINEKLDALWDQTDKLTINKEHVKEALKNQSQSLDRTNDNLRRVDNRLKTVENSSGIVPPPELAVF